MPTCSTCPAGWRRCSRIWACSRATASPRRSRRVPRPAGLSRGLRAGAVYLPLNTAYTAAEVDYFLGDAEPTVFVCRPELQAQMDRPSPRAGVPHLETLGEQATAASGRASQAAVAADVADVARGGRPRGDPLHLGHHRPLEGRHADATATCASNAPALRDAGASRPTTCCCTPCRSSTPTACSWPPTSRCWPAAR